MTRNFPSYTLAQLRDAATEGVTGLRTPEMLERIEAEIAARESGLSVHLATPQVPW